MRSHALHCPRACGGRMKGWLVGVIALGAIAPLPSPGIRAARHAAPVLSIRVVEDASRQPLPNAEVIDLDAGTRRFTNADGETRIPWPDRGPLRLRVRQL